MDWGKETQGTGTHEGPLAVVQVEIGSGKVRRKKKRHMGRERLGKYHQQDLATDLACTHVGGKLPETDSKQCSATVAAFLNLW